MVGMTSTVSVSIAVCALLAGIAAIVWLSKLNKRMTGLGRRLLESEDVGKIKEAAQRAASFEARMVGCENIANQNQSQLEEHKTRLSELAEKAGTTEHTVNRNAAGLGEVSEKMATLESRMSEHESKAEQSQNQLVELESKVNELISKLGAIEQTLSEHTSALSDSSQSMKVLGDEVQSLEEFQAAAEKARSLILSAFDDMKSSMPVPVPPEADEGTIPELPSLEENSQKLEW